MLVIGEKINVRTKLYADAFKERNFEPIKDMAIQQVKAGANMLDINIGPARKTGRTRINALAGGEYSKCGGCPALS